MSPPAPAPAATPSPGAAGPRPRWLPTERTLRLFTGLVLFGYVLTHLANHALGNVSLGVMEAGLSVVAGIWNVRPLAWLLYGSLLVHLLLGIWAVYARTRFQWSPGETLQLLLGLALPPLLVAHVVGTKVASAWFGQDTDYAPLLYLFWVQSPADGVRQGLALLAAWTHGCLGLYFWLRLKPGFPRAAPILLSLAILVPLLSLLGYVQAGRQVAALAADESWRLANIQRSPSDPLRVADQAAALERVRSGILWMWFGLLLLAIGARAARALAARRQGAVRLTYPDGTAIRVPRGTTVLEGSRLARYPHASVCGGRGRCSTCRVRVLSDGPVEPPGPAEAAVLERVGATSGVRLACQYRPSDDVTVAPLVPPRGGRADLRRPAPVAAHGEERFVAALFIDLRGSTRLAERRLPFDTVFLINRFLEAAARGVASEGGSPNQFLGDGMLALFGVETEPERAARQALAALVRVGQEVERLTELLSAHLDEPLRFGIGLHAGLAILGEIGDREHGRTVFTAIGDPVNVAARLQAATKALACEAIVSDAVFEAAGLVPDLPSADLAVDGREGRIAVRTVPRAAAGWRSTARSGPGLDRPREPAEARA